MKLEEGMLFFFLFNGWNPFFIAAVAGDGVGAGEKNTRNRSWSKMDRLRNTDYGTVHR